MFKTRHPMYEKFRSIRGGIYVIEGIVGIGKTTLGFSIENYLNKIGIKCKFFREYVNDDLLKQFISDMKKYAYCFQMIMIMKRIEIYREAEEFTKTGGVAFIDRSIPGDMVFAELHYKDGNISQEEYNIYNKFIKLESLPTPTACIYLKGDPLVSLERIKIRGIEAEIKGYNIDYVTKLKDIYDEIMKKCDNAIPLQWENIPMLDGNIIPDDYLVKILQLVL